MLAEYPDRFAPCLLVANRSVELLAEQAAKFRPQCVIIGDETLHGELQRRLDGSGIKVLAGAKAIADAVTAPEIDMVVTAMVGYSGLAPTISAIKAGKDIALANKETLVVAGELVTGLVRQHGTHLYPIDSEHGAIYQCLVGEDPATVRKLLLTASGGPFRTKSKDELRRVTKADALHHPNWSMGAKITIDSATMMNKGLEFIEAKWLFDMPNDAIEIVVHRESVVHSAIVYKDNSVIAQLGVPDMRIPIQYALTYPQREESPVKELSLADYGKLTFFEPDYKTFKCIDVCKKAIEMGGLHPAAANGANEESVKLFLNGKIKFTDIAYLNEEAMLNAADKSDFTLSDVLEADRIAREFVIHNYQ